MRDTLRKCRLRLMLENTGVPSYVTVQYTHKVEISTGVIPDLDWAHAEDKQNKNTIIALVILLFIFNFYQTRAPVTQQENVYSF